MSGHVCGTSWNDAGNMLLLLFLVIFTTNVAFIAAGVLSKIVKKLLKDM